MSSEAMEVRDAAASYAPQMEQGVPSGYKRTEVGVIPEDWECVTVDQIAKVKGGKRLPAGYALVDSPTPHPYIRVSDMRPGGIDLAEIKYVPNDAYSAIQNYRIYHTDIFISVAGTLGIIGVIPPQLDGANLTENADRLTDLKCDRDYLKYWLMSSPIQKAIDSIRTVGAQPKLALGRIAKFTIAIPPRREEQRAIATALSDVDALITALDRLIAKKRAIKTAAMQQLLTGKTRLPGFTGEWKTKRLGDVLTVCHGKSQSQVESSDGPFPILASGGRIGNAARPLYDKPSVLIGRKGTIDRPQYMDTPFWTVDTLFYTAMKDDNVAKFFHYRFCLIDWMQYNEASGVPSLNSSTIERIEISSPLPEEQTAIAQVLSDMDAEIAALEARRDKTRAIKQGMMQQLLTGRVRLVKPNSKEAA